MNFTTGIPHPETDIKCCGKWQFFFSINRYINVNEGENIDNNHVFDVFLLLKVFDKKMIRLQQLLMCCNSPSYYSYMDI